MGESPTLIFCPICASPSFCCRCCLKSHIVSSLLPFSQSFYQQGKMRLTSLLYSGIFASGIVAQQNLSSPQAACERLGSEFSAPHVTVNVAQYIEAGTNLSLPQGYNLSSCGNSAQVVPVDLCRIAANVATSNRSEITLEAWLPTNW